MGPGEAGAMIREGTSERKSRIISGPTNFSHIAHIGPGGGTQHLIDLPVVGIGQNQSENDDHSNCRWESNI